MNVTVMAIILVLIVVATVAQRKYHLTLYCLSYLSSVHCFWDSACRRQVISYWISLDRS